MEFKGFDVPKKKETNALITPVEMEKIRQFNQLKKEVNAIEERIKKVMLEGMKKDGIKKMNTEYFTATYVAPTERTSVDTGKLKADGLYEQYTKKSPVKESVRTSFKEV